MFKVGNNTRGLLYNENLIILSFLNNVLRQGAGFFEQRSNKLNDVPW